MRGSKQTVQPILQHKSDLSIVLETDPPPTRAQPTSQSLFGHRLFQKPSRPGCSGQDPFGSVASWQGVEEYRGNSPKSRARKSSPTAPVRSLRLPNKNSLLTASPLRSKDSSQTNFSQFPPSGWYTIKMSITSSTRKHPWVQAPSLVPNSLTHSPLPGFQSILSSLPPLQHLQEESCFLFFSLFTAVDKGQIQKEAIPR